MTMDMIIPPQISVEKKGMIMSSVMIIVITANIILFVMRRSRTNNHNDSDV